MADQSMTEVIIDTHGPTITVRAAVDIHTAAAVAMLVHDHVATRYPAPRDHLGGAGFTTDRRDTPPAQPSSMHWAPGQYPIQPPGGPE